MGLLSKVSKTAPSLPSRVVLYAAEKSGKTSFACYAPNPIFLMTAGETGLLSLIESGQVPETSHFPSDFRDWESLESACQELYREQHDFQTLVLDTANGAESLLVQHVVQEHFSGDAGAFNDYGKGSSICTPIWASFLRLLDDIRVRKKMAILFLHHARVKGVSNPTGKDWDQFRPEAVDRLWALTHKWADVITFYGIKVDVWNDKAKANSETRYLRCNPSPAIVAGNRYGMRDEITAPHGPKNLWDAFAKELSRAKSKARQAKASPAPPTSAQPVHEPMSQEQPATQPEPQVEPEPEPEQASEPIPDNRPTPEQVKELLATIHAADLVWPVARAQYGPAVGLEFDEATHVTAMTSDQVRAMIALIKPNLKRKAVKA